MYPSQTPEYPRGSLLSQQLENDGHHEGTENVDQKQEGGMMRTVSRRQEAERGSKASASWTNVFHFMPFSPFPQPPWVLLSLSLSWTIVQDWKRKP